MNMKDKKLLRLSVPPLLALVLLLTGGIAKAQDINRDPGEAAFFASLDLTRKELSGVAEAVKAKDWKAAKDAWAKHLEERTSPTWIWSSHDRKTIQDFLRTHGDDLSESVKDAEQVMRREFEWQDVKRTLTKDIAWSSEEYDKEWGNVLNRHKYWQTLGLAWWATGDDKYAEDWVFMLRDWIKENPVQRMKRGPWRTLETGIRAKAWFDVMNLFMDAPAFDAETKYLFTQSLIDHAHLLAKSERNQQFRKGNWQQTEASGLACIGIMFPELKEAASWREQAFSLLQEHIKNGIFPDGAQCELTPGYHYWMTLGFIRIQALAQKNGYEIPGLSERHEKMFEFLMQLAMPNRWVVPVGDAVTGKQIEMIMGLGALLYHRPDMRYLAVDEVDPDWIWMFPPEKLAEYTNLPKQEPTLRSHMMPYAQYGVMRTGWKKDDRFLLFDCAPWAGVHSHNDWLQVTLYSGRDLLVDSGQCSYDQPLAGKYYRRAKAHNGLLFDDKTYFNKEPKNDPDVLSWNVKERIEFASGRFIDKEFTHQRSVLFVKPDYWVVVDHVTGEGEHALTRLFHLPDVTITKTEHSVQTDYPDGDNLWIGCADNATIEMQEGWWRKTNGETPQTPVAALVTKQKLPATLCSALVPFAQENEIPSLERLKSEDPNQIALKVSFKNGRTDWIAIASKDTDLAVGKYKGKGMALCAREANGKTTLDVAQQRPLKK